MVAEPIHSTDWRHSTTSLIKDIYWIQENGIPSLQEIVPKLISQLCFQDVAPLLYKADSFWDMQYVAEPVKPLYV